ncbi:DUF559 domain-containing protein [Pseudonocardia xishanensis]|uniref:DUF559 domain-containing protein n=1 Tax=Pseudonocardia xishanensis TaxID=630995 RepID=A0ABP8S3D8_9PSEU
MSERGADGAQRAVARLLRRQAGVIGRAQAIGAGMAPDAVDRMVAARRWVPAHPRVYRDGPPSDAARMWAAVLWAGDGAVLSGVAAARWHGADIPLTGPVAVTVPRRRSPRSRPGVAVRRRDLAAVERTVRRGLAVTAPALSVLDAAVEMGSAGGPFLDHALRTGPGFDDVSRAYARTLGCAGSARMRALMVAAAERSAAVAERLLVRHLCAAGLGGWRRAPAEPGLPADLTFPRARVVVEAQGWARHVDAECLQRNLRRRRALARSGWTVLHLTWHDLTSRPADVVAEIAHAVGAAQRAS